MCQFPAPCVPSGSNGVGGCDSSGGAAGWDDSDGAGDWDRAGVCVSGKTAAALLSGFGEAKIAAEGDGAALTAGVVAGGTVRFSAGAALGL